MRHSSLEGAPAMGQGVGEGYTMAEMAHMRRAEMARSGVEKGRGMYGGEVRGPGGHYSSHMQQIPPGYRGHGDAGSYMRHMSADRDYATDMDEVCTLLAFLAIAMWVQSITYFDECGNTYSSENFPWV